MILDLPGTTGITMIRCMGTNCYIIEMIDGVMVVDAGWRAGSDATIRALSRNGFHPEDVTLIVLTHAHFDHFGFARELQGRTSAQTAAHRLDVAYYEGGGAGIFPPHIAVRLSKLKHTAANLFHAPPVCIDRVLEDGDQLGDWRVCHTPGHTPGTISLYAEKRKVLITGGWAIPGIILSSKDSLKNLLVGYISTDAGQLSESRSYLAGLDFQTLLCSHFRPQLFKRFARRLQALVK